jgi:predicted nucleic acid-binding protein
MLIDTDILIWYLRGYDRALRFLEAQAGFSISVVTYMELVQGMRNQAELRTLRRQLQEWQTPVLPITKAISRRAAFYVEQYFLSHSLRLADALLAATAVEHGLSLATGNTKHYQSVSDPDLTHYQP